MSKKAVPAPAAPAAGSMERRESRARRLPAKPAPPPAPGGSTDAEAAADADDEEEEEARDRFPAIAAVPAARAPAARLRPQTSLPAPRRPVVYQEELAHAESLQAPRGARYYELELEDVVQQDPPRRGVARSQSLRGPGESGGPGRAGRGEAGGSRAADPGWDPPVLTQEEAWEAVRAAQRGETLGGEARGHDLAGSGGSLARDRSRELRRVASSARTASLQRVGSRRAPAASDRRGRAWEDGSQ